MTRYILIALCIFAAAAPAVTAQEIPIKIPKETAEKRQEDRKENDCRRQHIPIPAFKTTPNSGETYGLLYALLFLDENRKVKNLFAPSITYNEIFGLSTTLRLYKYPRKGERYFFKLSKSTKINEDVVAEYKNRSLFHGLYRVNLRGHYFENASYRFYGIGPDTDEDDESDYTHREFMLRFFGGINLGKYCCISLTERLMNVQIKPGGLDAIPDTRSLYRNVTGIPGWWTYSHKIELCLDTRLKHDMSENGYYVNIGYEIADRDFGGEVSFRKFTVQTKAILNSFNGRLLSTPRILYQRVFGDDVPFYEQSMLGGSNLLRGFGKGRWYDRCLILFSLEERIRIMKMVLFNVKTDWQLTPFVEYGGVGSGFSRTGIDDFNFVYGLGFRAVIQPNIVGRVDFAKSTEGLKIFVELGYPF